MNDRIAKAADELLNAIEAAEPDELAMYFSMVGITGACFSGGVIEVFQEQLKAVAGRLALESN